MLSLSVALSLHKEVLEDEGDEDGEGGEGANDNRCKALVRRDDAGGGDHERCGGVPRQGRLGAPRCEE